MPQNLPRGKLRAVLWPQPHKCSKKQSLSGIWPCKQRFLWQKCRQFRKALKPFPQATLFRQHAPLQVGLQSAGKTRKRENCPDEEEIIGSFCALRQSAGSLQPLTSVQVCFPDLQLFHHCVSLLALSTSCPAPGGDFRAPAKLANAKIALMKKKSSAAFAPCVRALAVCGRLHLCKSAFLPCSFSSLRQSVGLVNSMPRSKRGFRCAKRSLRAENMPRLQRQRKIMCEKF